MCDSGTAIIYHLVDLDTWEVFYVGSTAAPAWQRVQGHAGSPTNDRMRDLFLTRRMGLEVIAEVPLADRFQAERSAIHDALDRGHSLVNTLTYGYLAGQSPLF